MTAYLRVSAVRGVARRVPEMSGAPDDAAGFRTANARLRELLVEWGVWIAAQDAEIAMLREQLARSALVGHGT